MIRKKINLLLSVVKNLFIYYERTNSSTSDKRRNLALTQTEELK